MKLWDKGVKADQAVEHFTVGEDRVADVVLARWDVIGSIAHAEMLGGIGLLDTTEVSMLVASLRTILEQIDAGDFVVPPDAEDVHSVVEHRLTEELGEVGKKIHLGRSRNDQIALDLKLYLRHEMRCMRTEILMLVQQFLHMAEQYRDALLPGYTHMQVAMPSSFGLWFGGYAEALLEDVAMIDVAIHAANSNPLGSAAGYGTSIPIDRIATTVALEFDRVNVTSTFSQMSRARTERIVSMAISTVAATLSKFAADAVLYMGQNFAFLSLPDDLTTGSSIMPHKKNPDVFEVLRARCNRIQALPNELSLLQANLPSGYHRDMQFAKHQILASVAQMQQCIAITQHVMPSIQPTVGIMDKQIYTYAFSVDAVNNLVAKGMPFRDAYRAIASSIKDGTFCRPDSVDAPSSAHLGSVANPGLDVLQARLRALRATETD